MTKHKSFLRGLDAKLNKKRAEPLIIKNPIIVFDPPEIIELRRELINHPDIVKKLGPMTDNIPTIIGMLAAEVDIVMDGHYNEKDLLKVVDVIIQRLRDKRGAVLVARTIP